MESFTHSQLVARLAAITPSFREEWESLMAEDPCSNGSLHAVYIAFWPYMNPERLSRQQLTAVAKLFNEEVAAGGDRENAVATCILEHLERGPATKELRRLLAPATKARLRA
jgi:hypothetical protein